MIENLKKDAINLLREMFREQVEGLIEAVNNQISEEFTKKINMMYKYHGLNDADGKLIQISTPVDLASRIVWADNDMQLELTVEEERWFRADRIHGRNLLENYGFRSRV